MARLPPETFRLPVTRMREGYYTDQYFNPRNTEAHLNGTGPEIVKDLDGRAPDWFIACVGTAGSSTGVVVRSEGTPEGTRSGRFLRQRPAHPPSEDATPEQEQSVEGRAS